MQIAEAQREVRAVHVGGFIGQAVSSGLWFVSAALSTWASPRWGIAALVLGGPLIFPLMQLILRSTDRPAALSAGNPMGRLAMQVAFTVPHNLVVVCRERSASRAGSARWCCWCSPSSVARPCAVKRDQRLARLRPSPPPGWKDIGEALAAIRITSRLGGPGLEVD